MLREQGNPPKKIPTVNEKGRMDNGHHRTRDAVDQNIPIDIQVILGQEPPSDPPSIADMPFIEDE